MISVPNKLYGAQWNSVGMIKAGVQASAVISMVKANI
jgi:hypothetical protein